MKVEELKVILEQCQYCHHWNTEDRCQFQEPNEEWTDPKPVANCAQFWSILGGE